VGKLGLRGRAEVRAGVSAIHGLLSVRCGGAECAGVGQTGICRLPPRWGRMGLLATQGGVDGDSPNSRWHTHSHNLVREHQMSVTFNSTRPSTCIGHAVSCYAYGSEANWQSKTYSSQADALNAHTIDHIGNPDCDANIGGEHLVKVLDTDVDPSMNVSNTNAAHLLELLGLVENGSVFMYGSIPAVDMRGRILLARALAAGDVGRPATVTRSENGPTVHDGGRQVGYADKRLDQLEAIVDFAETHGVDVSWG